jgi:hypothetical protein
MRSPIRLMAVMAVVLTPVVALGVGSAAAKHTKPKAGTPQILITASPNPVVEFGTSNVLVIIQVEANPAFANSTVTISSTQLVKNCKSGVEFESLLGGSPVIENSTTTGTITLTLDNDGNVTFAAHGTDCAPGTALFEASLNAPPFATAVTKLVMQPPQVTPPGVKGFPRNEVETGDGGQPQSPGNGGGNYSASDVYAIFYVETSPVFAEQTAIISSNELIARCGLGYQIENIPDSLPFVEANGPFTTPPIVQLAGQIDNDGNVAFLFAGASCAAGKSTVIVEITKNGPTYSTQFNILPPAVTI